MLKTRNRNRGKVKNRYQNRNWNSKTRTKIKIKHVGIPQIKMHNWKNNVSIPKSWEQKELIDSILRGFRGSYAEGPEKWPLWFKQKFCITQRSYVDFPPLWQQEKRIVPNQKRTPLQFACTVARRPNKPHMLRIYIQYVLQPVTNIFVIHVPHFTGWIEEVSLYFRDGIPFYTVWRALEEVWHEDICMSSVKSWSPRIVFA